MSHATKILTHLLQKQTKQAGLMGSIGEGIGKLFGAGKKAAPGPAAPKNVKINPAEMGMSSGPRVGQRLQGAAMAGSGMLGAAALGPNLNPIDATVAAAKGMGHAAIDAGRALTGNTGAPPPPAPTEPGMLDQMGKSVGEYADTFKQPVKDWGGKQWGGVAAGVGAAGLLAYLLMKRRKGDEE